MGFRSNGDNNWKLIDLNISTTNVSGTAGSTGRGNSNYGLWINSSSGYEIIRCSISTGSAGNGNNGSGGGANGVNGDPGSGGGSGSCDSNSGGNGGAGGSSGGSGVREGGNGGSGGNGRYSATNGNNGNLGANGGGGASRDNSAGGGGGHSDCNGGDAGSASGSITTTDAANGANGSSWGVGDRPTNYVYSTHFVPGAQANFGGDGGGGGGGAGGGGGGGQGENGCCWCTCLDGTGNGGGGGGEGGQGGQGGGGAWGGGGTFAIWVNGTLGSLQDVNLSAGTVGTGGSGQGGGSGGNGGNGANGASSCSGEVGIGGRGSRGGHGGNGGRGRDGANGQTGQLVDDGVTSSPSVTIPTSPIVTINYNNHAVCINSAVNLEKNTGSWTLPTSFSFVEDLYTPGGTSYGTGSTPIEIYTTTPSISRDVVVGGTTYGDYLQVTGDNRTAPVITVSDNDICAGASINFSATSWGTELEYSWEVFDDVTPTVSTVPVYTSTLESPTSTDFTTPGTYLVKYQVREECCGWSIPDYETFQVANPQTAGSVGTDHEICSGGTPSTLTNITLPSGGTGALTYQWQSQPMCTGAWSDISGATSSTYTPPAGLTETTCFRRGATNDCGTVYTDAVTVTVNPNPVVMAPPDPSICSGNSTTLNASVSSGTGSYTYLWAPGGTLDDPASPTPVATPTSTTPYTVTVTDDKGCQGSDNITVIVNPSPSVSVVSTDDATCNGGSDGSATVSVSSGTAPFTYVWDDAKVWINEIHYDNTGGDVNEGVEIAGVAGIDLNNYSIELMNGSGGGVYNTINLSGIIPNEENGFGTLWFAEAGIQNGNPDGLALVDPANNVLQFLSYEGSFTATAGAANGQTSVDIGVSESSSTAVGVSLQLVGTGAGYPEFTWVQDSVASAGSKNDHQTFVNSSVRTGSLAAGTYTVTVIDANGCEGSTTVVIGSPNEITVTETITPPTCFGGTDAAIDITASGGNTTPAITLDGTITEADWGSALATSAGGPSPGFGAGHEINAVYVAGEEDSLYFALAGNVQSGNRILMFIDSKSGGYSDGDYGRSGAPEGVDDFNSSSTFDAGFTADYCVVIGTNGAGTYWLDLFTLSGSAGSGGGPNTFIGDQTSALFGVNPANADNTRGFEFKIAKSQLGWIGDQDLQVFPMYSSDGGWLSNQFLTRAGSGETDYTNVAITFGSEVPNPVTVTNALPYSYSWTPGGQTTEDISGIASGGHTVTVTDFQGCTGQKTITVNDPVQVTATITTGQPGAVLRGRKYAPHGEPRRRYGHLPRFGLPMVSRRQPDRRRDLFDLYGDARGRLHGFRDG